MQRAPRLRGRITKGIATPDFNDERGGGYRRWFEFMLRRKTIPNTRAVFFDENGKFLRQMDIIPNENKAIFKSQFFRTQEDSSIDDFIPGLNRSVTMRIIEAEPVVPDPTSINQTFREEAQNDCVVRAILSTLDYLPKTENPGTLRNRKCLRKKVECLRITYPDGITTEDLNNIGLELKLRFKVLNVLGKSQTQTLGCDKSKLIIPLWNTNLHHVRLYTSGREEQLSREALDLKMHEIKKSGEFFVVKNSGLDNINQVSTKDATYILEHPTISTEFADVLKGSHYNVIKHPELNEFILQGRIINSWFLSLQSTFPEHTRLFDMRRAYTKHRDCPYYEGFLYQPQVFQRIDHIQGLGIYQFLVVKDTPFSRKFGLIVGNNYILPSPEIAFWDANGVELDILGGVFGQRVDFDFPESMVEDKSYSKWCGKLSQAENYKQDTYRFPADEAMSRQIARDYVGTQYWAKSEEVVVSIPKENVWVAHHVYAFITSYCRITMLNIMKDMQLDDLIGVCCDGIYTTDKVEHPLFVEKKCVRPQLNSLGNIYADTSTPWYSPSKIICPTNKNPFFSNTFLSGSGGSGKTYSVMRNKCYIDVLYVCPTHELGETEETGYATHHKLVGGNGCVPYCNESWSRNPPVILMDEITMAEASFVEKALKLYPRSLILLAGDMNRTQHYQCRGGTPGDYTPLFQIPADMPIVEYTTDYRAKGSAKLITRKKNMRKAMNHYYTDGGIEDAKDMIDYVKEKFPVVEWDDIKGTLCDEDIFLWSTHRVEVLVKPYPCQMLGVHCSQGKTLQQKRVIISTDAFEYAMPYTALSRCVSIDQVVWVNMPIIKLTEEQKVRPIVRRRRMKVVVNPERVPTGGGTLEIHTDWSNQEVVTL